MDRFNSTKRNYTTTVTAFPRTFIVYEEIRDKENSSSKVFTVYIETRMQ